MTLQDAIDTARRISNSFSRLTGRTEAERAAGMHMVVIYAGEGRYLARFAYEVAEDDSRQVWDSIAGLVKREPW